MCSKRNLLDKVVRDNFPDIIIDDIVIDEAFYVVGHRLWFDKKEALENDKKRNII